MYSIDLCGIYAVYNTSITLNAQAKEISRARYSEALRLALEADTQLPSDGPHGELAILLSIRSLDIAYTSNADKTLLKLHRECFICPCKEVAF